MISAARNIQEPISPNSVGIRTIPKTCKTHGGYDAVVINVISGREVTALCPKCADDKHRKEDEKKKLEELNKKQLQDEKLKKNKETSGIPLRFVGCMVSNYKTNGTQEVSSAINAVSNYIRKYEENSPFGTSMILCGKVGTGKTHLACAIGNYVLSLGKTVKYITTYQAIASIKETYRDSGRSETDVYKEYLEPDLLILDEVGIQFGSDAEKIIIYQIINGRYASLKPMILISNLNEEGLINYIGETCVDRIKDGEGAIVPFTWCSYRPQKRNS